jgi:cobalt-precorrin 5A hydrolase
MRIQILSFTAKGAETAERIRGALAGEAVRTDRFSSLRMTLREYTDEAFSEADAVVFVGACGIAVRAIAPFVRSKTTDPAVLAADEQGKYVIPILSGHLGGANVLARVIAAHIGAEAVITTATDLRHVFAVDLFAKDNGLTIVNPAGIKAVSSAVLAGQRVGFFSELNVEGPVPAELSPDEPGAVNIVITSPGKHVRENAQTLHGMAETGAPDTEGLLVLIPEQVVVGIGCRRGESAENVSAAVSCALRAAEADPREVGAIATIDRKADEPALIALAKAFHTRLLTYTAGELARVPGEFANSAYVEKTVGVGNVCGRSAVRGAMALAGNEDAEAIRVLLPKTVFRGVTCSVARYPRRPIRFEEGAAWEES